MKYIKEVDVIVGITSFIIFNTVFALAIIGGL